MGFKNGMLGKFVRKKQANIEKGKGKKNKIKKPNILMFSKKGLMDKSKEKWTFEREDKRKTRK